MVLKRSVSFITGCCWRQTAGQKSVSATSRHGFQYYGLGTFRHISMPLKKKSIRNFVLVDIAVGIGIFFLPLFYNRIDILH